MMAYSNLSVAPGADIGQVNAHLLQVVNAVLGRLGLHGTVISGYRSPQHSVAVGGYATDPHTRGEALDILVNGRPLGDIPGAAAALAAAGLVSGAQPNFFKGHPDPAHVQLGLTAASPSDNPEQSSGQAAAGSSSASSAGCLPATLATLTTLFGLGVAIIGHFL